MRPAPPWIVAAYAALIRLYPMRARRRFRDEQLALFGVLWQEERPARRLAAAFWLTSMFARGLGAALASHLDARHYSPSGQEPRPHWRPISEMFMTDLRQALRSIRRARWYSIATAAVVAAGLALAATVFALVDGVLFKPLPFRAPDELYVVRGLVGGQPDGFAGRSVSPLDVRDWQAAMPEIALAVHHGTVGVGTLGVINGPTVWTRQVDARFWDVLGVRPLIGGFEPADHDATETSLRPVLISYGLWHRLFGGDLNIVGRRLEAAGRRAFRVAGVLPRDFVFPHGAGSSRPDVLLPTTLTAGTEASRGSRYVEVIARIPASVDIEDARARLTAVTRQGAAEFRNSNPRARAFDAVDLAPLHEAIAANERPAARVAAAAVATIVLLVGVNAGGLAVSRSLDRARELAARRALGASVVDLARMVLIEASLLVAAGTAAGIGLAQWLLNETTRRLPDNIVLFREPAIDTRVVWFTLGTAALMTIGSALVGVRTASRISPALVLGQGAGAVATPRRSTGRVAFEAAQIALAVVLVIGGALFVTSVGRAWRADTGYNLDGTLYLDVRPGTGEGGPTARAVELLQRLRTVPGVTRAGMIDMMLLAGMRRGSLLVPDTGVDSDVGELIPVSSSYFELAGVRAVEGRLPTDNELDAGALVAVVSERVSREYWPGQSPISRILSSKRATVTVIGVVKDARFQGLDRASSGEIYVPVALGLWTPSPTYLVRGASDQASLLRGLIAAVRAVDPAAEIRRAQTVEDALADSIRRRRFQAWLFGLMAAAGLVVAGTGILGLTAASAAGRTREMGVRLALGSTRERLLALMLREQFVPVAWGLTVGLAASAWGARFARTLLYELSEYDPLVWSGAAALVLSVAVVGTLVPAWRAARVDPLRALRVE